MGFKSEEDLEIWYAAEKERLSEQFMNSLDKDKEKTPKYKERFNAEMKKLIAKYNSEYEKLLAYEKRKPKKE